MLVAGGMTVGAWVLIAIVMVGCVGVDNGGNRKR